jgi:hypothetical protein
MQRMLAKLPQLAEAAAKCPGFEDYCRYLPDTVSMLVPALRSLFVAFTTAPVTCMGALLSPCCRCSVLVPPACAACPTTKAVPAGQLRALVLC